MLIDFHTHVFPDKIAARAIESLKAGMISRHGRAWPSYASGSVEGLLESMNGESVDVSVMMPIATKPAQAESINRFARAHASERLIAFGTVHPAQENWESALETLAVEGRPGIKLHPEFQDFYIDSPESVRILKKCGELGLMVTFHSGEDIGCPPPVHAAPDRIRRAADCAPDTTLIAAHMGGWNMWEEAAKLLKDTHLMFDTAYVQLRMSAPEFRDLTRHFGAERVLFASDSPWARPATDMLSFITEAGLNCAELDLVTHKNALRLLGMNCSSGNGQ